MTTTSGPSTAASYHFVITIQTPDGGTVTDDGTIPIPPGPSTRAQVFDALRAQTLQRLGHTVCAVLFFALEPNQL